MDKINKILLVFAAAVIACHAEHISTNQGLFNRYFVYDFHNSRTPIEIDPRNITSSGVADIRRRSNTTVIVHGHRGSFTTSLNPTVKDAYLISHDRGINVIVVDWSVFASQSYAVGVASVPSVGVELANVITQLVYTNVVSYDSLHLVGFDLGAHVVGIAGRALDGRVARITGLSPAGRNWGANSLRLNKNDAYYVEVIHTDTVGVFRHGISDAIGDMDFFVNGGRRQPGCLSNYCSHNRSWEVFAASLLYNHLIGKQCRNRLDVTLNTCRGYSVIMGNNEFNKIGSGMFRVNTRRNYPY